MLNMIVGIGIKMKKFAKNFCIQDVVEMVIILEASKSVKVYVIKKVCFYLHI